MDKLRVILADDHPLTIAGVQDLLSRDVYIEVVAAVSTSSALVEALRRTSADVVITDYTMPGDALYGDGIRFIEYLVRQFPAQRLLVLTMIRNPMIVAELYAAGVWGVVFKHDKLSEISSAVHCLRLGNKYYPDSFMQSEKRPKAHDSVTNHIASLSPREFEVIRLFVRGESVAQIASNLKRSIKTVSTQKRSAMVKLGVSTDQDLVAFCVEQGLFS